jgi:hypothetical protein
VKPIICTGSGTRPERSVRPARARRASRNRQKKPFGSRSATRFRKTYPLTGTALYGQEYSADTRGNITNIAGKVIANPQGVGRMVEAVRGRAGGRFRVTPKYRLVIISRFEGAGLRWSLAGQLHEAFEAEDTAQGEDLPTSVLEKLLPGALFTGRANAMNGTFRLRQKSGGVIERKIGREVQVAIIDASSAGGKNGSRTIEAWRSLGLSGMEVYVSAEEIAWYREDGRAKVLAYVPGGFAWPPTPDSKET